MMELYPDGFVTPIHRLDSFCDGNEIFIKRDDLLPFSFGGNKERIARCFFDDAEKRGCDCIIAYGSPRSNLVRVIANMAASKRWPCYVVSSVDDQEETLDSSNFLLASMFDAKVKKCEKSNVAHAVRSVMEEALGEGLRPYYVYGDEYGNGNEATPVRGYVEAYEEIADWESQTGFRFDYIFCASGTGMTQAGLICGALLKGSDVNIVGISVARDELNGIAHIRRSVRAFMNDIGAPHDCPEIRLTDRYLCGGYGKSDEDLSRTIRALMREEGIPSDPTYVGKGFNGMLRFLKDQKVNGKRALFIHTGGSPLFFDYLNGLK